MSRKYELIIRINCCAINPAEQSLRDLNYVIKIVEDIREAFVRSTFVQRTFALRAFVLAHSKD